MATPTTGFFSPPLRHGSRPFQGPLLSSADAALPTCWGLRPRVSRQLSLHPALSCCSLSAPSAAATPPISFRSPPQSRRSSPATSARDARRSPAPAPATLPRSHLPLESPHQMPDLLVRRRAAESPKFAPHGFRAQTLAGGVEGGDSRRRIPGASRAAIIAGRLLGVVVSGA